MNWASHQLHLLPTKIKHIKWLCITKLLWKVMKKFNLLHRIHKFPCNNSAKHIHEYNLFLQLILHQKHYTLDFVRMPFHIPWMHFPTFIQTAKKFFFVISNSIECNFTYIFCWWHVVVLNKTKCSCCNLIKN